MFKRNMIFLWMALSMHDMLQAFKLLNKTGANIVYGMHMGGKFWAPSTVGGSVSAGEPSRQIVVGLEMAVPRLRIRRLDR